MPETFAILTDLSGVTAMRHDSGGFASKEAALVRLVEMLEGRRVDVAEKLTSARRALRRARKGEPSK